jgi:hypothetical protein
VPFTFSINTVLEPSPDIKLTRQENLKNKAYFLSELFIGFDIDKAFPKNIFELFK